MADECVLDSQEIISNFKFSPDVDEVFKWRRVVTVKTVKIPHG